MTLLGLTLLSLILVYCPIIHTRQRLFDLFLSPIRRFSRKFLEEWVAILLQFYKILVFNYFALIKCDRTLLTNKKSAYRCFFKRESMTFISPCIDNYSDFKHP